MKHFKHFSLVFLLIIFLATSCKKEIQDDTLQNSETIKKQKANLQSKINLQKLRTTLPTGYEKRLQKNASIFLNLHPEYRYAVQKALKVISAAPCDDNTALTYWLNQQIADWDDQIIFFALVTGMLDFPIYDALLFENNSSGQTFGVNGEFTHATTKTFKDLQRFWNIQSKNIVLAGMHGSMLRNRDKVIRIDMILYGDTPEDAAFWADLIGSLLKEVPQYRNGDHPIFTFNSYAQAGFAFPPYGLIPSKIIMGDGISQGFNEIGFGDVAPQAIVAHEFGHHIQFQLNVFSNEQTPEATRRTELMADAYSAYFLSHARGASMQWKRVKQFLQVFFNIGDCAFTSAGHHGTPTQRMASAEWAYSVANNAQKQGHILTAQQFTAMFDAALPGILAH